ncbi:hypothetical protein T492DRAFT_1151751 [Pavlovales sp. CCMP2436]|nr:hypothetical protein T492DRAFT_1151751 [Pavlovales sp. CCMP2436]
MPLLPSPSGGGLRDRSAAEINAASSAGSDSRRSSQPGSAIKPFPALSDGASPTASPEMSSSDLASPAPSVAASMFDSPFSPFTPLHINKASPALIGEPLAFQLGSPEVTAADFGRATDIFAFATTTAGAVAFAADELAPPWSSIVDDALVEEDGEDAKPGDLAPELPASAEAQLSSPCASSTPNFADAAKTEYSKTDAPPFQSLLDVESHESPRSLIRAASSEQSPGAADASCDSPCPVGKEQLAQVSPYPLDPSLLQPQPQQPEVSASAPQVMPEVASAVPPSLFAAVLEKPVSPSLLVPPSLFALLEKPIVPAVLPAFTFAFTAPKPAAALGDSEAKAMDATDEVMPADALPPLASLYDETDANPFAQLYPPTFSSGHFAPVPVPGAFATAAAPFAFGGLPATAVSSLATESVPFGAGAGVPTATPASVPTVRAPWQKPASHSFWLPQAAALGAPPPATAAPIFSFGAGAGFAAGGAPNPYARRGSVGLGGADANGGRPQTRYPAPGSPLDAAKFASKPSSPLAEPLPLRNLPSFAHPAAVAAAPLAACAPFAALAPTPIGSVPPFAASTELQAPSAISNPFSRHSSSLRGVRARYPRTLGVASPGALGLASPTAAASRLSTASPVAVASPRARISSAEAQTRNTPPLMRATPKIAREPSPASRAAAASVKAAGMASLAGASTPSAHAAAIGAGLLCAALAVMAMVGGGGKGATAVAPLSNGALVAVASQAQVVGAHGGEFAALLAGQSAVDSTECTPAELLAKPVALAWTSRGWAPSAALLGPNAPACALDGEAAEAVTGLALAVCTPAAVADAGVAVELRTRAAQKAAQCALPEDADLPWPRSAAELASKAGGARWAPAVAGQCAAGAQASLLSEAPVALAAAVAAPAAAAGLAAAAAGLGASVAVRWALRQLAKALTVLAGLLLLGIGLLLVAGWAEEPVASGVARRGKGRRSSVSHMSSVAKAGAAALAEAGVATVAGMAVCTATPQMPRHSPIARPASPAHPQAGAPAPVATPEAQPEPAAPPVATPVPMDGVLRPVARRAAPTPGTVPYGSRALPADDAPESWAERAAAFASLSLPAGLGRASVGSSWQPVGAEQTVEQAAREEAVVAPAEDAPMEDVQDVKMDDAVASTRATPSHSWGASPLANTAAALGAFVASPLAAATKALGIGSPTPGTAEQFEEAAVEGRAQGTPAVVKGAAMLADDSAKPSRSQGRSWQPSPHPGPYEASPESADMPLASPLPAPLRLETSTPASGPAGAAARSARRKSVTWSEIEGAALSFPEVRSARRPTRVAAMPDSATPARRSGRLSARSGSRSVA